MYRPTLDLVKEVCRVLGANPISTGLQEAPGLVRLVQVSPKVPADLAESTAWLALREVVRQPDDGGDKDERPLTAARHLLGLVEYPKSLTERIPDLEYSAKQLHRVSGVNFLDELDPLTLAGQRRLIAAIAGNYGRDRTTLMPRRQERARRQSRLDEVARAVLTRFWAHIHDDNAVDRLVAIAGAQGAATVSPELIAPRLRHREHLSQSGRESAQHLEQLSRLLADDLDAGARRGTDVIRLSDGLYVRRDIESTVIDRLLGAEPAHMVIKADAGFGKSSVLWSLYRELLGQPDVAVVLVSATWLIQSDAASPLSRQEVIEFASDSAAQGLRPIVLLDTADLLLHDELLRLECRALLDSLRSVGARWVITSRPLESYRLKLDDVDWHSLKPYSASELMEAARALSGALCTAVDEEAVPPDFARAVARELPASDVCRSPLLLRLLFEVSAPHVPRLDIDVTGLYQEYWSRRVQSDRRDEVAAQSGLDLSVVAGGVGIVMLAIGTPEVSVSVLTQSLSRAVDLGEHLDLTACIAELIHRGVLVTRGDDHLAFFHQTVFEYAAAQGLLDRAGIDDLPKLVDRVIGQPLDLFTAAVLEQVIISGGRNPFHRSAIEAQVRRLRDSHDEAVLRPALAAAAHHPWLRDSIAPLSGLSSSSLSHLARALPAIQDLDLHAAVNLLDDIWTSDIDNVCLTAVDAVARLAYRHPGVVAEFCHRHDVVRYVTTHKPTSPVAQDVLPVLLETACGSDPAWARRSMLTLLETATAIGDGRAVATRILRRIARVWDIVGSGEFLDELTQLVVRSQIPRDSNGTAVREALATVLASACRASIASVDGSLIWSSLIDDAVERLTENDQSVVAGATIVAMILHAIELPDDDPRISEIIDRLHAMPVEGACRQLQRSAFPIALSRQSAFADALTVLLKSCLTAFRTPQAERPVEPTRWAEIARSTLADSRVTSLNFTNSIPDMCWVSPDVWMRRDGLIFLLALGAEHGVPGAAAAAHLIAEHPESLGHGDMSTLLDGCEGRSNPDPVVVSAMVSVAIALDRSQVVRSFAELDSSMLATHADALLRFADELLAGHNSMQSKGAHLLATLAESGVIALSLDELQTRIQALSSPEATAELIRALRLYQRADDPRTVERAIGICRRYLDVQAGAEVPLLSGGSARAYRPVVLDACRDAWLELVAFHPQPRPEDWATIKTLALAPRLSGREEPTVGGIGNAAQFAARLLSVDESAAVAAVRDLCIGISSAELSSKQMKGAAERVRITIQVVLERTSWTQALTLVGLVDSAHPSLGAIIARSAVQVRPQEFRNYWSTANTNAIDQRVRAQVHDELRIRDRQSGTGLFPEILSASPNRP